MVEARKERQEFPDVPGLIQPTFLEQMRSSVRSLYDVALDAADPYKAALRNVRRKGGVLQMGGFEYDLSKYEHVYVAGSGKAAAGMAKAMEAVLGERVQGDLIYRGQISIGYGCGKGIALKKIGVNESRHPVPDEAGVVGAEKIRELLSGATERDLVIYLATGGGSSILTLPAEGITLGELQETTQLLLKSGATLPEMNYVRKHLDLVKGGQLARAAYPAELVTLVLSDVVGDPLDMISSGPTVPDPHTFREAYGVLERYNLLEKVPASVRKRIEDGVAGMVPETPKEGDECFKRARSVLVGTNRIAVKAMVDKARSLGFDVVVEQEYFTGEAREVAKERAKAAVEMPRGRPKPLLVLAGGEPTVTIRGTGVGGRNQEYALAFALAMEKFGFDRFVCLSCATDGVDYIREATGAMVDGTTLSKARALGLNPEKLLENNDSYHFHEPLGTLIKTGPSGTNVNDVQAVAVW